MGPRSCDRGDSPPPAFRPSSSPELQWGRGHATAETGFSPAAVEAAQITAGSVDDNGDGKSDYLTLTADNPGVPFRVETSTSDAGGFEIKVTTSQQGDPGQNEIQRVSIPAVTSGGTFSLTFQGQTTAAINHNAPATGIGSLQEALEALPAIEAGDVSVTGVSPAWSVEFQGNYANTNVPLMVGNGSNLTGSVTITHSTITDGAGGTNEIKSINKTDSGFVQKGINNSFFKLWYQGQESGYLSFHYTAEYFQEIIEAIFGVGNVLVTAIEEEVGHFTETVGYTIEFIGDLGHQDVGVVYVFDGADEPEFVFGEPLNGFAMTTVRQGDGTGINEVQTIRINGSPTGGTFTVSFQGQTTASIAHNADAATLEAALEALSNIDDVTVTKSGSTYTVTFIGSLSATDVGEMTSDASALTGAAVTTVTTQQATVAANELQRISFSQPPGGGTFQLSWDAGGGDETTAAIDWDASAAEVRTALEALTTPGPGDFSVTGPDGGPWTVEFRGTYAGTNVDEITGDASGLTGGGSQDLVLETLVRSAGPNHFDDPDNWTGEAVPDSQDALFYNGGKVHCLYGLKQRVTFTADDGADVITFDEPADFVEGQAVRLFTTDTLPAPLSTGTTYYIVNLDYDAGTCQLSLTADGEAIDLTDAGTGIHTIALHLAAIHFHSRWTGNLGFPERNEADYYEYLPRSLAVVVDTITIGEGEGDGQSRLDVDTGEEPVTLIVHQTGGSNEPGLPAIR